MDPKHRLGDFQHWCGPVIQPGCFLTLETTTGGSDWLWVRVQEKCACVCVACDGLWSMQGVSLPLAQLCVCVCICMCVWVCVHVWGCSSVVELSVWSSLHWLPVWALIMTCQEWRPLKMSIIHRGYLTKWILTGVKVGPRRPPSSIIYSTGLLSNLTRHKKRQRKMEHV